MTKWNIKKRSRSLTMLQGRIVPKQITATTRLNGVTVENTFTVSGDEVTCTRSSWYGEFTTLDGLTELAYDGNSAYQNVGYSPVIEWEPGDTAKTIELKHVAEIYKLSPTRGTQNVLEIMGLGSKTTAIRRVMDARKYGYLGSAA